MKSIGPVGPVCRHVGNPKTCTACAAEATSRALDCHPYHRVYVGGKMDGHITHLFAPDFPKTTATSLFDGSGQSSWYVREDSLPGAKVGYYRHTGDHTKASAACRTCHGTGDADNTSERGQGPFCRACAGSGYQPVADASSEAGRG